MPQHFKCIPACRAECPVADVGLDYPTHYLSKYILHTAEVLKREKCWKCHSFTPTDAGNGESTGFVWNGRETKQHKRKREKSTLICQVLPLGDKEAGLEFLPINHVVISSATVLNLRDTFQINYLTSSDALEFQLMSDDKTTEKVNEDGWYLGELADGRREFIPSNCVKEVSDDNLENKNWGNPCYYLSVSHLFWRKMKRI
ncbi:hypothetical protein Q9233_001022 [Columba guinea]|nr:hypothetical protein Q9233_001022 [Columba guinea]